MLRNKKNYSVFAPPYYEKFKCIKDRCKHSCCIDWEILIDEAALERYRDHEDIMQTIAECDDGACFKLCCDGRCPHLNSEGLCNMIINHGEGFLSDICNNHPRFYSRVSEGQIEAGIGLACEEACRIILECEHPFPLIKLDKDDCRRIPTFSFDDDFTLRSDILSKRAEVFSVLENDSTDFASAAHELFDMLEIRELYTADEWTNRFLELEILDTEWRNILTASKNSNANIQDANNAEFDKYYLRLLAYFVFRHVGSAVSYDNMRARLGFAIISAKMIKSIFEKSGGKTVDGLIDIARRYSSEIEYSEENTAEIIFEFESSL